MTTIQNILEYTESFAPLATAADYDNCGILVGDGNTPVSRVLVALDITPEVVAEAAELSAELIISHHPVIFNPLRTLSTDSVPYKLAQKGIAALCLHTNLDIAQECGVNLCLANALKLSEINVFPEEFLAIGELHSPMSIEDFAAYVKEKLSASAVAYTEGRKEIKTVAMCSGAGGDFLGAAINRGADVFLTGEARHHEYLEAEAAGIPLVTAGHFSTEDVVVKPLCRKLADEFSQVEFISSKACHDPVRYI